MGQLTMNSFIAGDLRAIKPRTQPIDLIIDFPAAFIQRVSQRRIDPPQLLLQIVKFLAERLSGVLKRRRCFLAKIIRHDARGDKIGALKEILKANPVSLKWIARYASRQTSDWRAAELELRDDQEFDRPRPSAQNKRSLPSRRNRRLSATGSPARLRAESRLD